MREDAQLVEISPDNIRYIRVLDIECGKTNFYLKSRESYIDRSSKDVYKECSYDEIIEEQPRSDPFRAEIYHEKSMNGNNTVYKIRFWTHTDIWFEDTEIGKINRNRLRDIFKMLYDTFDVVDTFFDSNMFDDTKMKNVVFG